MILFNSGSVCRCFSILFMEWITVVWCFPPKARPISGSEASVSSFTRYMATWRGRLSSCVLLFSLSCDGLIWKRLGHGFLNGVDGDLAVLHMDQVLQNLLRHLQM